LLLSHRVGGKFLGISGKGGVLTPTSPYAHPLSLMGQSLPNHPVWDFPPAMLLLLAWGHSFLRHPQKECVPFLVPPFLPFSSFLFCPTFLGDRRMTFQGPGYPWFLASFSPELYDSGTMLSLSLPKAGLRSSGEHPVVAALLFPQSRRLPFCLFFFIRFLSKFRIVTTPLKQKIPLSGPLPTVTPPPLLVISPVPPFCAPESPSLFPVPMTKIHLLTDSPQFTCVPSSAKKKLVFFVSIV